MKIKFKIIVFLFVIALPIKSIADNSVNVYCWANTIPQKLIKQFTKETGIKVHYSEYENNETLYAKLKANPNSGYDVIFPSSYYIQRMVREHMLEPLDRSLTPLRKNINPKLMQRKFDPTNEYSLPYMWGSTGIAVNDKFYDPSKIHNWKQLWSPQFKNQLLVPDDYREVFSIALITLGYSINDENPAHIKQAYQRLLKLMPNIKIFNSDTTANALIDEDIRAGVIWNGDAILSQKENKHIHFIYPQPAFSIWIDCASVAANSPHRKNAMKFINFINRPKIAKMISDATGESSPNLAAVAISPKNVRDNKTIYPSQNILARAQLQSNIGSANIVYEKYWQLLKLGGG